jgi:prevent-host-death family protein
MANWQLQEAKNKFSEVVNRALSFGPQFVTRHGKETVVVLSVTEYRKLAAPAEDLATFFANSPLRDSGIDLERDKDTGRDILL